jgi:hypothetical protein
VKVRIRKRERARERESGRERARHGNGKVNEVIALSKCVWYANKSNKLTSVWWIASVDIQTLLNSSRCSEPARGKRRERQKEERRREGVVRVNK